MNIQPVIGNMRMCDVKPMHCKIVLNRMEATYAGSAIRQAYTAMGTMFRAAVMNDLGFQRLEKANIDRQQDTGIPA